MSVLGVAEQARVQAAGSGCLLLIVRVLHFRYWCALACVSVIEAAAGPQRFPGYHHAKLLLLLWLQSARYQGAARLYRLLLRPALEKLRPSMETFLAQAAALAVLTCTAFEHWLHVLGIQGPCQRLLSGRLGLEMRLFRSRLIWTVATCLPEHA